MEHLIAGFDAGQTHTSCRLALVTTDGLIQPVASGEGPGISHLAASGGEERFLAALRLSYAAARGALEEGSDGCLALGAAAVGASGLEAGTDLEQRGQALIATALGVPLERVRASGDERTALLGACGHGAGILVISGTGSIALGQDGHGREHRCGGWGWQLDGAGSAMDLGRDGLALSLRMADGRLPESPLRARLWAALADAEGITGAAITGQWIKAQVVTPGFAPAGFARLAPAVNRLAAEGDPGALAIVQHSANALVRLVAGVAGHLELEAPAVFPTGGALTHLDQLRSCFAAALQRALPASRLKEPTDDALAGALQVATALLSCG
ncbi:N-acetylglucosamine kinase [Cyanobium sp. Morenito 9A2]|uniref:N-acetylglucosamine kinase n=1 Tax=Cyanobium sp. Morenito 9A2 TaxID=2823718 RepID=UPI0020CD8F5C|nr:acetate and sugar kinases/Hsc70/actin family protein [Cyanobium sp. Morenito 9A2]MCP9849660.1 N-acetylglucosamine kinase [Cyanobium sp. Morenito 9A2]